MVRRFLSSVLLLALLGCAAPRRVQAQFIGYTSPQTVQQTLATNTACTGSAQTFTINNLGQTQHYLSVASVTGAQSFQAEIDGIDNQGNIFRISDVIELAGINSTRQGTVFGGGYFPKIQIVVTCVHDPQTNPATFSASYSGAWATFNGNAGSYLSAQIDKINFFNASEYVNQSDTVQTPFGTSAGTMIFRYGDAVVTGGTLTISCTSNGPTTGTTAFSTTLAATTNLQVFNIPDTACPFATVAYGSPGGAGIGVVQAEYVFTVPGISNRASSDPCQSGSIAKTSAVITAGAAATTQVIALIAENSIYVCGYQVSQIATAGTLRWVYGTGVACGTGTTNLTGAMGVTASSPISYSAPGYVMKVPTGNALCLTTTGAGGTAAGIVTYIQAP